MLDEEAQREIIQTTVSAISVFFDSKSMKHRLTVTFTENVSQCIRSIEQATHQLTAESFGHSCEPFNFTEHSHRTLGNSLRSQSQSEKVQSSLVDDGGVVSLGPLSQKLSRNTPKILGVSIGPLTLDIRPLSSYQQSLIDTIHTLRSRSWSDRQIANYFNETGYKKTPRGHRFIAQSVFSIRKKYEKRLARLGDVS